MGVKTRAEYLRSLQELRPNVYKFGKLITDVTLDPATRRTVESHARAFDAARDPVLKDLFTTTSSLTGDKILRFNSLMTTPEDVINNARFKRACYRMTGTCTGGLCVGWNAANVMWAVTHDIDRDTGTDYHKRLKLWLTGVQQDGLVVAGALTDAKGNRSLKPSQQPDPDSNLRIVEVREDGIVISGAKVMICGVAASNEIFVLPGSIYGESDSAFAVACAVPRDIEGLTIVETRRPSDERELEDDSFDIIETGITQAYLMFDHVFVPRARVFLCGEYKYTAKVIQYFTATYRACIGACVAGQGDVMVGAAAAMARVNGLAAKTFMNKLSDMSTNHERTFGLGVGAIALGKQHEAGPWFADALLAHTNKVMVATLPYETKRLCQDIGGGIVETGCFPSYKDFTSPEYGHLIQKYIKAGDASAETRARMARLTEWLTLGAGVPGCMHGGGSPDGARMVIRANTPLEEYVDYARSLAGVTEEIPEPKK